VCVHTQTHTHTHTHTHTQVLEVEEAVTKAIKTLAPRVLREPAHALTLPSIKALLYLCSLCRGGLPPRLLLHLLAAAEANVTVRGRQSGGVRGSVEVRGEGGRGAWEVAAADGAAGVERRETGE
jgi:hypothetical protein